MNTRNWTTGLMTALLGGAVCLSTAMAEEHAPLNPAKQQEQAQPGERHTANYGATASQHRSGPTVRVSSLIGKAIENHAEQSVGEVSDIVLDARTGKIQYVAVTYGGFLGMGNKMFAVPYQAFEVNPEPEYANDPDNYVLLLDVTQEKLEGAEGFDENHWPDTTDPQFTRQMNERYGVKHEQPHGQN